MIYADTDFFMALLKPSDWLKKSARKLLKQYQGKIFTSQMTLVELLLLAVENKLDPERLLLDAMGIAQIIEDVHPILVAAHYIKEKQANVFDALHASFCGKNKIISSDKIFDKLGLERIPLAA